LFQAWITLRMKHSSIVITSAVALAVAGGSAFTASNTGTPIAAAGFQATASDGFTVTDVEYDFGALATSDTGNDIAQVAFTLDPIVATAGSATQARVRLVVGADFFDCSSADASGAGVARTFTCAITSTETADVDTLEIVAVSQAAVTP